ncbi:MAG: DUF2817 domain-containing protein [Thermoleophilaceae bacterium]
MRWLATSLAAGLLTIGCGGGSAAPPPPGEPSGAGRVVERESSPSDRDDPRRRRIIGRSSTGRAIDVVQVGDPTSRSKVLVIGCIHGTECEGTAVTRRLELGPAPRSAHLWIVENLNPDGFARGVRQNADGVDLNRNFPSGWRPFGVPFDQYHSGPRPLSEPETRAAARLVRSLRPDLTIWFHQPEARVRAYGPSVRAAREYARLARVPYDTVRWPPGSAPNWQNHRFPGAASFVVELPVGSLATTDARRHTRAVRELARLPLTEPAGR